MERISQSSQKQLGQVFVITGPSGVGKGTLCKRLLSHSHDLRLSVSATTRPRRPDEVHGEDYYFLDDKTFEAWIKQGEMLEWARYNNCYYGTPKPGVEKIMAGGQSVLLEIETQGALMVKEQYKDAVLIFLMPPSLDHLKSRLVGRGTNDDDDIASRLSIAQKEMAMSDQFQHVLVNDDLEQCYAQLLDVVKSYKQ